MFKHTSQPETLMPGELGITEKKVSLGVDAELIDVFALCFLALFGKLNNLRKGISAGVCARDIDFSHARVLSKRGIAFENNWLTLKEKWLLRFLRSMLGVRTSTPSWGVLRECGIVPIQFNWFRACAHISRSPRNSSYWTSHLMSAMNGLHHAHHFSKRYALLILWN
eukprot:1136303-Pelagomonas_calceolata.AAC.2